MSARSSQVSPSAATAVDAAYCHLSGHPVARTVHVSDTVLVDVDAEGQVVGVEQIGRPVDMGTLVEALRTVRP